MRNLLSYEEWLLQEKPKLFKVYLKETKSSKKTEQVSENPKRIPENHIQHFLEEFTKL
jgi:hypothetical protein